MSFKVTVFNTIGWTVGIASLGVLAWKVYELYQGEPLARNLDMVFPLAGSLAGILIAMRLRGVAGKLAAREEITRPAEQPVTELHPALKIYEERRGENGAATSGAGVASSDFAVQLRKLHELKEANIITEAEFEQKKSEILARIG